MPNVLRRFERPVFWLCLALFFGVLGAKLTLIKDYGSDLPYWDQWDAEAHELYIPWAGHRLTTTQLFAAHNEHRIVLTRLLALGLLEANGQWDARLQTVVNALLHSAIIASLGLLVSRWLHPFALAVFVVGCALIAGLPVYAENTLVGFQSQFYFLVLFAGWNIAGTTLSRPGSPSWYWGHLAGVAGLLAMASGFVSSAIVIGLTACRLIAARRRPSALEWMSLAWSGLIVATGYCTRVEVPGHEALRSGSLGTFLHSMLALAAWPTRGDKDISQLIFSTLLSLAPVLIVSLCWWIRKGADQLATLILGLSGWWAAQVILLAFARGGEGLGLASRYFDILAIQSIATLLSWLWIFSKLNIKRWPVLVALIATAGLWAGTARRELRFQTDAITQDLLVPLLSANVQREASVRDFVSGRLPSLADKKPWYELPYPDSNRLESILVNPAIREILPSSVRPRIVLTADAEQTHGFASTEDGIWHSITVPPGRTVRTFSSEPFSTRLPFLRFDLLENTASLDLSANAADETSTPATRPSGPHRDEITWVRASTSPVRINASAPGPDDVSFPNPAEWGRFGLLAYRVTFFGAGLTVAAGLSFSVGLAFTAARFFAARKAASAEPVH